MPKELKINEDAIYFADFETLTLNNKTFKKLEHTAVYMWGLLKYNNDNFKYGKTIETFFREIMTPYSKIIYFHNLTFDGNFIYKYLLNYCPNLKYKDEVYNADLKYNYWTLFRLNRKIYFIEIKKRVKTPKGSKKIITIKFACTYNLINSSIATLSKQFSQRDKHDKKAEQLIKNKYHFNNFYDYGDWDIWENEELKKLYLDYLYNDIYVAREAFKFYKKTIESNKYAIAQKWGKKNITLEHILTTASLAQKLVRNYLYTTDIIPAKLKLRNYDDYILSKLFLRGGMVQFNDEYKREVYENGFSIDRNSSYPASMTQLLPYGKIYRDKEFLKTYKGPYLTYVKCYISFDIKESKKKLIFMVNNNKALKSRYLEIGEGEYYFLYDELKTLQQIYNITIHNIEYYYCKADYYLRDFINNLYNYKANAPSAPFRNVFKLLLNSLYGSFIKKPLYPTIFLMDKKIVDQMEKENIRVFDKWSDIVYKQEEFKCLNARFISAIDNEKLLNLKYYPNFLVGATITAWSRINLMETCIKIGANNFIYSDTDSIFFKWKKSVEELKKLIDIDDTKLGAWKIEYNFNKGKVLGAKRYVFTNEEHKVKKAHAGIKYDDNDYNEVLKFLEDGYVYENARYQVKEDNYGIYLEYKDILLKGGTH